VLNLLGGRFLTPDAISLETNRRQCRGFEADKVCHFHGKPWRRVYDAREQIRIINFCGNVLIGAGRRGQ